MTGGEKLTETQILGLSLTDVCTAVLDAAEDFDKRTLPLGLYACQEYRMQSAPFPRHYQEWVLCLAPCLKRLGFDPILPSKPGTPGVREGIFAFGLLDSREGVFNLVRASNVKVRKFGSAYRIDAHARYEERWDNLRLNRQIPDLWKPSSFDVAERIGLRMYLFIGFAREPEPYGKELAELQETLQWEKHNVEYQTRIWTDREGRAFFVRLCVWAAEIPDPTDEINLQVEAIP